MKNKWICPNCGHEIDVKNKYQVFLSSTFTDLENIRSSVERSLRKAGYIVTWMEDFTATSEDIWNQIKEMIDESDFYVLISKGRYGDTIRGEDISYTEKEYRYACKCKKRRLGFLYPDEEIKNIPFKEVDNYNKLMEFRAYVRENNNGVKIWNDENSLPTEILNAVNKEKNGVAGWVRGEWETPPTLVGENLADDRTELKTQHEPASDKDSFRKLEETLQGADFSQLPGTWVASSGTGTATGRGGSYELRLRDGAAILTLIGEETDTRALVEVTEIFNWDVFRASTQVYSIPSNACNERGIIYYIGDQTYRYTFPSGSRIDVTVLDSNSASVREVGTYHDKGYPFLYDATYTLTRQ